MGAKALHRQEMPDDVLSFHILHTQLPHWHSGDLSKVSMQSNKKKKSLLSLCFRDSCKQWFGGCSSSARIKRESRSSNQSFRHNTKHSFYASHRDEIASP